MASAPLGWGAGQGHKIDISGKDNVAYQNVARRFYLGAKYLMGISVNSGEDSN